MKEPVYKGIRKGYTACWLSDPFIYKSVPSNHRLRFQFSNGKWTWFNRYSDVHGFSPPCWFLSNKTAIADMDYYDNKICHQTIFIGYMKE